MGVQHTIVENIQVVQHKRYGHLQRMDEDRLPMQSSAYVYVACA